jgi:hypothetical protein
MLTDAYSPQEIVNVDITELNVNMKELFKRLKP